MLLYNYAYIAYLFPGFRTWGDWKYINVTSSTFPNFIFYTYSTLAYKTKAMFSAHILCECEALAAFRHRYLGSFFLEPEDVKSISLGAI